MAKTKKEDHTKKQNTNFSVRSSFNKPKPKPAQNGNPAVKSKSQKEKGAKCARIPNTESCEVP